MYPCIIFGYIGVDLKLLKGRSRRRIYCNFITEGHEGISGNTPIILFEKVYVAYFSQDTYIDLFFLIN